MFKLWSLNSRRVEYENQVQSKEAIVSISTMKETLFVCDKSGIIEQWMLSEDTKAWILKGFFRFPKRILLIPKIIFFTLLGSVQCETVGFCGSLHFKLNSQNVFSVNHSQDSRVEIRSFPETDSCSALPLQTLQPKTFSKTSFGMCLCFAVRHSCESTNDATHLLVGYENGSVVLWSLQDLTMLDEMQLYSDPVMSLDYNSNVNKGVCVSAGRDVIFWTITDSGKLVECCRRAMTNPGGSCVRIRSDGRIAAVGCWDSRARVFSVKSGKLLAVLDLHKTSVQSVSFSDDGLLALAAKDGAMSLWDFYR